VREECDEWPRRQQAGCDADSDIALAPLADRASASNKRTIRPARIGTSGEQIRVWSHGIAPAYDSRNSPACVPRLDTTGWSLALIPSCCASFSMAGRATGAGGSADEYPHIPRTCTRNTELLLFRVYVRGIVTASPDRAQSRGIDHRHCPRSPCHARSHVLPSLSSLPRV